jgi:hypothetical protein
VPYGKTAQWCADHPNKCEKLLRKQEKRQMQQGGYGPPPGSEGPPPGE